MIDTIDLILGTTYSQQPIPWIIGSFLIFYGLMTVCTFFYRLFGLDK